MSRVRGGIERLGERSARRGDLRATDCARAPDCCRSQTLPILNIERLRLRDFPATFGKLQRSASTPPSLVIRSRTV